MLEVAVGDQFLLGMRLEPALALAEQLVHFIASDPVVLVVVQHGNQDVEVREQVLQTALAGQLDREVRAFTPLGKILIQRMPRGIDRVAQRLEQTAEQDFAAATRHDAEPRGQRNGALGQLGALIAPARQSRSEYARDGDAHERRRDVGPIVDILLQKKPLARRAAAIANQADRIDVEQQRGGTPVRVDLRIEDVRLAEGQIERLASVRVFVQQIAQVAGRSVGCGNGQQHGSFAHQCFGRPGLSRATPDCL